MKFSGPGITGSISAYSARDIITIFHQIPEISFLKVGELRLRGPILAYQHEESGDAVAKSRGLFM